MVWGVFPADPQSGEDKYYIFSKGTYKVGRKGCDIIINKDKGVSRIHGEIVIDSMASLDHLQNKSSNVSSRVRIRDFSKYGTFINKNLGLKEKVHEFPNKETTLKDGDLISFGTGNATYRFCFVPLVFFVHCSKLFQENQLLQDKISSLGASITHNWSLECTHVLVDQSMPLTENLIDAAVAKKPFVLYNWVEFVAEKNICTEIPSCSSYAPNLMLEGVSVKAVDPESRDNCLRGYTFLLESTHTYKFKVRLQSLLEAVGGKVLSVEGFSLSSQGLEDEENNHLVHVIPARLADKFEVSHNLSSLSRVNEMKLICAAFSGQLDPSIIISPSVLVSSSCSTDETVVAESDAEIETVISVHTSADVHMIEAPKCDNKVELSTDHAAAGSETGHIACFMDRSDCKTGRRGQINESESGNADIKYSEDLIVRDTNLLASVYSSSNNGVPNFKIFRKTRTQSGNSFNNLIPFSKYPYKDSDYGSEEVIESVKEEKKRKQMEAVAEDLFNNEKGRRRGVAGSLRGLFASS